MLVDLVRLVPLPPCPWNAPAATEAAPPSDPIEDAVLGWNPCTGSCWLLVPYIAATPVCDCVFCTFCFSFSVCASLTRLMSVCNVLSHLISSSSLGAQIKKLRFGVMIRKQFSFFRFVPPPAAPAPPPTTPPTLAPTEDATPAAAAEMTLDRRSMAGACCCPVALGELTRLLAGTAGASLSPSSAAVTSPASPNEPKLNVLLVVGDVSGEEVSLFAFFDSYSIASRMDDTGICRCAFAS